ncbi:hypothetical protein BDV29DRAFT_199053 [Aspergillus leporis]|uniref:Ketoreductase domain-containing protein n=1 Tax=Aspergillus leporis TaxID=41062 RepID=A0A5N5XD86_9EURO|nr:hypothetical protein BDV29DRAFT_199053 [Aspergillus leporis]
MQNKTVALVTGANSGIGQAVAQQLARQLARQQNHHVILTARNPKAGAKAAVAIIAEGHSASFVHLGVTPDASIAAVVQHIQETYGKLNILVNNAGTILDGNPSLTTREIFQKTFDTNVTGTAILTDSFLGLLRQSTAPRVVFVSSSLGSMSRMTDKNYPYRYFESAGYKTSKAALDMLVAHYAWKLEDVGGLVNAACPGLVQTKLSGYASEGVTAEVGAVRIVELALLDGPIPW